jgi:DNA-directed RNA polymerase subunit RPC12/RpoP
MSSRKFSGHKGEVDVIRKVGCPNCGKSLMQLPENFPLSDVICTGCSFRAQIKTRKNKPVDIVFGAGWQVIEKVLKSGFLMPQLFLNFVWSEKSKQKH